MNRRERLLATLAGKPVDRPAVSFYEIGGWVFDCDSPDPYNVHNDPSWRALVQLAEEQTDLIRMTGPRRTPVPFPDRERFVRREQWEAGRSRFVRTTITVAGRTLTSLTRRDADVDTTWTVEHLLKGTDDLRVYLELPDELLDFDADWSNLAEGEAKVGDAGIQMVDVGDPICSAADLFSMEEYTVVAMTEGPLFHRLLEKFARPIHKMTAKVAREFPGRLWRVVGAEYAGEPYLPPRLFQEYVVRYTGPMVREIQAHGGTARIHCHGRLKNILPMIRDMGAGGLDPVEPPPQGDMELIDVRRDYGRDMVLFGNIEAADIENLAPAAFEKKVAKALREGTAGEGRGFVLHPSACPYGRTITPQCMANYETMVRLAQA